MTLLAWTMMRQRTADRGQRAEDGELFSALPSPSAVSGAGIFFLVFLLLLINFLGDARGLFSPLKRAPAEDVFVQVSDKISPFQRLTLGMPISINRETAFGLTAIPGIGPKTASAIVRARERTGGFKRLKDLMSVRGINESLFARISPYLTL